jgi:hypothetical protein
MLVIRGRVGREWSPSAWKVSGGEVAMPPAEPRPPVPASPGNKAPGDLVPARLAHRWAATATLLVVDVVRRGDRSGWSIGGGEWEAMLVELPLGGALAVQHMAPLRVNAGGLTSARTAA